MITCDNLVMSFSCTQFMLLGISFNTEPKTGEKINGNNSDESIFGLDSTPIPAIAEQILVIVISETLI